MAYTCYFCGKPVKEGELEWTYAGGATLKPVHRKCYYKELEGEEGRDKKLESKNHEPELGTEESEKKRVYIPIEEHEKIEEELAKGAKCEVLPGGKVKCEVTKEELEKLPSWFAEAIYNRLYEKASQTAIDWATHVANLIEECESRGGIPQFRTRYAGKHFPDPEHPGKFMVLFICYGREIPRMKGVWLSNVPKEDIERLEAE